MQAHSQMLADAVRDNARQEVLVEWSSDFVTWKPLKVFGGTVTQDRNQIARWSTNLECEYPADFTLGDKNGLHPYGCRVRIRIGVHLLRTNPEYLSYGVFRIDSDLDEKRASFSFSATSLEKQVAAQEFPRPRRIPDKSIDTIKTQTERLVREAVPDATFEWDPTLNRDSQVFPATEEKDRWKLILTMMDTIGAEISCGPNGEFRIDPTPSASDAPVWDAKQGIGGVAIETSKRYSSDRTYNLVIATGQLDDGVTVVGPAYAWDNDPDSLTYAGPDPVNHPEEAGPFGVQPYWFSSPLLGTLEACLKAARTRLRNVIGTRKTVSFTSRFHPALEAGDVVQVEVREKVYENHLIDSLSYSLGSGTAACGTRTAVTTNSAAFT